MAAAATATLVCGACGSSSQSSAPTSAPVAGTSATTTAGATRTASAPGVTPTTITLGLLTSVTGDAASTFADTSQGAQARIDLQNAHGGVDGRTIHMTTADDQSSTTQALTASQALVDNDHVFGVMGVSAFLFAAYKQLQTEGVPVTGGGFDGPEWGEQPNTNMFTFTPVDAKYPGSPPFTVTGQFFKSIGSTNVAEFASQTPSSVGAAQSAKTSVLAAGLKNTYQDLNFPFGGVDFTAQMLQLKQQGVDAAYCVCVESSDLALSTAAKDAGVALKQILATGYDQQTLDDPAAVSAAQGQYFTTVTVPFELGTAPTAEMLAAMKQYVGYTGTVPDYGQVEGWLSADLMISGLQLAGANPTRTSFIDGLRTDTSYTGGGLLPNPVNSSLAEFGTVPRTQCTYYVQLQGNKFVPLPKRCGTFLGT